MTSLKFSKFNFFAAISNIYAQFVPVSRDFILHISRINNFPKVLAVCANGVIKNFKV